MNIGFEKRCILNLKHRFYKISVLVHVTNIKHIQLCINCTYKVRYMDLLHKQTVTILPNIQ